MAYSTEFCLIKAVKKVTDQNPYYSPACVRVRFRRNDNISTMNINCSLVISYNKSFVDSLTNTDLEKIVLHEILHYINGHHGRYINSPLRKILPHNIHNMAMDLEINEFIDELPKGGFKAKDFGLPDGKSYEEYLGIINRDMPQELMEIIESGKMPSGELLSGELDMDGYNEIYQEILADLVNECERAAGTGGGSGNKIRRIKKRKYPWQQVFQNIIATKMTDIIAGYKFRSYQKTNRRLIHFPDIIMPQYYDRKSKISLIIIMDISGSMGDNVNKMYGVMKSILDILDIQIDITVLEVNTNVEGILHGFDLKKESIKSNDGGGTDMGAGLYYILDEKMEADLIVVMTDSFTPWPDPPVLTDKTVVLTDNPDQYDGPYTVYPVYFGGDNE